MKNIADIDFSKTYGDMPEGFALRVRTTLLAAEKPRARRLRWTAALAAALAVALATAAVAAMLSPTASIFGWFYGAKTGSQLMDGDIAVSGQSCRLGDVVYTLDDVIWLKGELYGTGTIRPAEGASVVLLPEDYSVFEPMGYTLHYGEEVDIPDDAPSYTEAAASAGARIVGVRCLAEGVVEADGSLNSSEVGYSDLPQPDGSIRFTFTFSGGAKMDQSYSALERASRYVVRLRLFCWEVAPDGEALRDEDNDTTLKKTWDVTVTPNIKED